LKQKLTIVAMILMAALFIATPVLAAGSSRIMDVQKKWEEPTIISMTATIAIDYISRLANTGKIYVDIQMTNRAFIQYRGQSEWVWITKSTKCLKWVNKGKSIPMACSDLSPTDKVSINAKLIGGDFYARQVLLYQQRIPQ
jgi:hypothetical protein